VDQPKAEKLATFQKRRHWSGQVRKSDSAVPSLYAYDIIDATMRQLRYGARSEERVKQRVAHSSIYLRFTSHTFIIAHIGQRVLLKASDGRVSGKSNPTREVCCILAAKHRGSEISEEKVVFWPRHLYFNSYPTTAYMRRDNTGTPPNDQGGARR
jgi:hypothetical protein